MKVRAPWRKKNYRPLSFSKGFGWRATPDGKLNLSLGRGRLGIALSMPKVLDSATGEEAPPELWGEVQLCWDQDNRRWSLRISCKTTREVASGPGVGAVDEGIINSMALATWVDERTVDVSIINGREERAGKCLRNKSTGALQAKIDHTKNGSRRHRRLVRANKRVKGKARGLLRDFDHQVARKAAEHVISHETSRLVYGDVRGIEQKTKKRRSAGCRQRQRLSQWSRGRQERYVDEKTGLEGEHLGEDGSTKTCPACGARNRPYTPIGPDAVIRTTYLRAVERWSPHQRSAHSKVQRRKARALSSASNRATLEPAPERKATEAKSSTGSQEPGQLAVVA